MVATETFTISPDRPARSRRPDLRGRCRHFVGVVSLLVVSLFAGAFSPAVAQEEPALPPATRNAALKFVREHHPELGRLLRQLRESDPAAFHDALKDLSRTHERLARLQERQPDRYEMELESWKLTSRIRLLVARSGGDFSEQDRDQLRELLGKRNDLRVQLLKSEQTRITDRLETVNRQIQSLEGHREQRIEEDLARLLRAAPERTRTNRRGNGTSDIRETSSQ